MGNLEPQVREFGAAMFEKWVDTWKKVCQKLSIYVIVMKFITYNSIKCGLSNGANIVILILHFDVQNGGHLIPPVDTKHFRMSDPRMLPYVQGEMSADTSFILSVS